MTDQPIDPRAAETLHLLSRVRGLLDQHERTLRLPGVHRQCNLDIPHRAMSQALHALAMSWNAALANVTELPPVQSAEPLGAPPAAPSGNPKPTEWSTVHPLGQRVLNER